jgi:natural product precursor
MSMSSFSAFALTKSEMKNVIGGDTCHTCYCGTNYTTPDGSASFNQSQFPGAYKVMKNNCGGVYSCVGGSC